MMIRLLSTVALAGVLATAASAQAQESYDLQFQSSDNSGTTTFEIQQDWAEKVGEMSDGRISVEMVPVGSIVEYNETLDAVGSGILDGHITDSSYFTGKDAAFALIGNPVGAYSSPAELRSFFNEGGGPNSTTKSSRPMACTSSARRPSRPKRCRPRFRSIRWRTSRA
ncbi:type 2 periplasmic-binding domain-containing protein [Fodinicurvata halophila]|uniref:hypothetical protein n=1 Tax=Fodinicurvata halophila TaxID=1419723 RepID=UPI00364430EF